jgi:hypothetical protein
MADGDEILEKVVRQTYAELSVAALLGEAADFTPTYELPPALERLEHKWAQEMWKRIHADDPPPPPPKPQCDLPQIGPLNSSINFSGPVPVGGWTQLTLRGNGSWNFDGHLHDSGGVSYDDAVVWIVKNNATGEAFQLVHKGRMHGTFEAGSRDDDWGESGVNPALEAAWESLCEGGWSWVRKCGVNMDVNSVTDAALKAVGAVAAVIALF